MNLLDENFQSKEEKNGNAVKTIILVAIILVFLIICGIIGYISYIRSNTLRTYVNGQEESRIRDILVFEEDGSVYVPIKEIARYIGYESYNGEYNSATPNEPNKCYVQTENEIANFELGSNKVYKLDLTKNTDNYEYVNTRKPVKAIGGVLYADSETFEKAFNVSFNYDASKKTINILTLPYLVQWYTKTALDLGYANLSETFANQKTLLNDMLVVEKADRRVGVVDTQGNAILEPIYQNIEYLPNMGTGVTQGTDFLVTRDNKVGIMSRDGSTKIQIIYDSIELLDIDQGLYIAKRENKYGVLDVRGKIIIHVENEEIGCDISRFRENGIKNKYILAGNLVPVKKNQKWGLYDLKGNLVVDFEYDSLGYVASSNRNALNLLVIPDYNVIVACKEKKYILLSSSGQKLFEGAIADDIYMQIDGGKKSYYINANNQIIDAEQYLDRIGLRKGTSSINVQEPTEEQQGNQQSNSQEQNNNNNNDQETNNESNENNSNNENNEQQNQNNEQNNEQQNQDNGQSNEQNNEQQNSDNEQNNEQENNNEE